MIMEKLKLIKICINNFLNFSLNLKYVKRAGDTYEYVLFYLSESLMDISILNTYF